MDDSKYVSGTWKKYKTGKMFRGTWRKMDDTKYVSVTWKKYKTGKMFRELGEKWTTRNMFRELGRNIRQDKCFGNFQINPDPDWFRFAA
jgi:hypothetical protein